MLENIPLSSKLANIYHVVTLELHGESSIYTGSALLMIIIVILLMKVPMIIIKRVMPGVRAVISPCVLHNMEK